MMATEKRLIDASPLIDECKECSAIEWNRSVYTTWAEAEEDFMQRLLNAPTVDAVEVVRCKNCKHFWESFSGTHSCKLHKGLVGTKYDAYCSYGERKDNG